MEGEVGKKHILHYPTLVRSIGAYRYWNMS